VWSAQLGEGYSNVAVRGERLYTMGNRGGKDTVFCLNTRNGKVVWSQSYPCPPGDYTGPRITPTLDGAVVYTLSRQGQLFCFNAASGKVLWGKDLRALTGAKEPTWGYSGSPLVYGNLLILNVGATGAAVDKRSGKVVWKSGPGPAGYSSPMPFTLGGKRGIVLFSATEVVAVDPAKGRPLWRYPWRTQYDVNAADPIVSGDTVFISSNYNHGGALLRVAGSRVTPVWQNRNMRNFFGTCLLIGGYLYGNDDNTVRCLDLRSGTERWQLRGVGKGGLIAAAGKLLILTERGELVIATAKPDRYTELARAKVLDGTNWNHPTLANGFVYCRNHEGLLVCLDLRGK
jgi:outer membrane protein assembly factor BamB